MVKLHENIVKIKERDDERKVKNIVSLGLAGTILAVTSSNHVLASTRHKEYNPDIAAIYAIQHANKEDYNKKFKDLTDDGDCTNFVSQCVYAGGISMKKKNGVGSGAYKTDSYWYHYKNDGNWYYSTSWIRVAGGYGFYDYWYDDNHGYRTYSGLSYSTTVAYAGVGDVIQIEESGVRKHSLFVVRKKMVKCIVLHILKIIQIRI